MNHLESVSSRNKNSSKINRGGRERERMILKHTQNYSVKFGNLCSEVKTAHFFLEGGFLQIFLVLQVKDRSAQTLKIH